MIRDATGKGLDAMKVFSISIKYITDHLFKSLSDKYLDIEMDDIHFVLTVPAIWDHKAKQFMTEAARRVSKKQLPFSPLSTICSYIQLCDGLKLLLE